jgi:hypothetical protein
MAETTSWRIQGEAINTCNCAWGCPCQFNALPTRGRCEAFVGFRIDDGHFGATKLDGLKVAGVYSWPGPIHEGNGTCQPVIDERASPEQREALLRILSGKEGCAFFEIFASMVSTVLPPKFQAIDFELDRDRRVGRLASAGVGEALVEPIRNPMSGEEHRAQLTLPNGFEFTQAEMASAARLRARAGDRVLEFDNTHAHVNAFDWGRA